MLNFSLRPAGLSDDPNDHLFRCNGVDVGRCYRRFMTGEKEQWSWSIYIGIHVKRTVEGIPLAGYADTLDLAQQQFREAFGRLYDAGAPRSTLLGKAKAGNSPLVPPKEKLTGDTGLPGNAGYGVDVSGG